MLMVSSSTELSKNGLFEAHTMNQTGEHDVLTERYLPLAWMIGVLVVSIVGNSLVIAAFFRDPRLKVIFNLFVVHLAAADLILSCLMLLALLDELMQLSLLDKLTLVCQLSAVLANAVPVEQLILVHIICNDRHKAMQRGMSYTRSSFNWHVEKLVIFLTWVISFVGSFLVTDLVSSVKMFGYSSCRFSGRFLYVRYTSFLHFAMLLSLAAALVCIAWDFRKRRSGAQFERLAVEMEDDSSFLLTIRTSGSNLQNKQSTQSLLPRSPLLAYRDFESIPNTEIHQAHFIQKPVTSPASATRENIVTLQTRHYQTACLKHLTTSDQDPTCSYADISPKALRLSLLKSDNENWSPGLDGGKNQMGLDGQNEYGQHKCGDTIMVINDVYCDKSILQPVGNLILETSVCGDDCSCQSNHELCQQPEQCDTKSHCLHTLWSTQEDSLHTHSAGAHSVHSSTAKDGTGADKPMTHNGGTENCKDNSEAQVVVENSENTDDKVCTELGEDLLPVSMSLSEDELIDIPQIHLRPRTDSLYTLRSCLSISEESLPRTLDELIDVPSHSEASTANGLPEICVKVSRKEKRNNSRLFTIGDEEEEQIEVKPVCGEKLTPGLFAGMCCVTNLQECVTVTGIADTAQLPLALTHNQQIASNNFVTVDDKDIPLNTMLEFVGEDIPFNTMPQLATIEQKDIPFNTMSKLVIGDEKEIPFNIISELAIVCENDISFNTMSDLACTEEPRLTETATWANKHPDLSSPVVVSTPTDGSRAESLQLATDPLIDRQPRNSLAVTDTGDTKFKFLSEEDVTPCSAHQQLLEEITLSDHQEDMQNETRHAHGEHVCMESQPDSVNSNNHGDNSLYCNNNSNDGDSGPRCVNIGPEIVNNSINGDNGPESVNNSSNSVNDPESVNSSSNGDSGPENVNDSINGNNGPESVNNSSNGDSGPDSVNNSSNGDNEDNNRAGKIRKVKYCEPDDLKKHPTDVVLSHTMASSLRHDSTHVSAAHMSGIDNTKEFLLSGNPRKCTQDSHVQDAEIGGLDKVTLEETCKQASVSEIPSVCRRGAVSSQVRFSSLTCDMGYNEYLDVGHSQKDIEMAVDSWMKYYDISPMDQHCETVTGHKLREKRGLPQQWLNYAPQPGHGVMCGSLARARQVWLDFYGIEKMEPGVSRQQPNGHLVSVPVEVHVARVDVCDGSETGERGNKQDERAGKEHSLYADLTRVGDVRMSKRLKRTIKLKKEKSYSGGEEKTIYGNQVNTPRLEESTLGQSVHSSTASQQSATEVEVIPRFVPSSSHLESSNIKLVLVDSVVSGVHCHNQQFSSHMNQTEEEHDMLAVSSHACQGRGSSWEDKPLGSCETSRRPWNTETPLNLESNLTSVNSVFQKPAAHYQEEDPSQVNTRTEPTGGHGSPFSCVHPLEFGTDMCHSMAEVQGDHGTGICHSQELVGPDFQEQGVHDTGMCHSQEPIGLEIQEQGVHDTGMCHSQEPIGLEIQEQGSHGTIEFHSQEFVGLKVQEQGVHDTGMCQSQEPIGLQIQEQGSHGTIEFHSQEFVDLKVQEQGVHDNGMCQSQEPIGLEIQEQGSHGTIEFHSQEFVGLKVQEQGDHSTDCINYQKPIDCYLANLKDTTDFGELETELKNSDKLGQKRVSINNRHEDQINDFGETLEIHLVDTRYPDCCSEIFLLDTTTANNKQAEIKYPCHDCEPSDSCPLGIYGQTIQEWVAASKPKNDSEVAVTTYQMLESLSVTCRALLAELGIYQEILEGIIPLDREAMSRKHFRCVAPCPDCVRREQGKIQKSDKEAAGGSASENKKTQETSGNAVCHIGQPMTDSQTNNSSTIHHLTIDELKSERRSALGSETDSFSMEVFQDLEAADMTRTPSLVSTAASCSDFIRMVRRFPALTVAMIRRCSIEELKERDPELCILVSLVCIVMIQLICWLPVVFLYMVYDVTGFPQTPSCLELIFVWLWCSRMAVQPALYACYSKYFRQNYIQLILCQHNR